MRHADILGKIRLPAPGRGRPRPGLVPGTRSIYRQAEGHVLTVFSVT